MLRRRVFVIGMPMLALGACGDNSDKRPAEALLPTRTVDGRIIVRGQGLAYAIRGPDGWSARSVRGADLSTKSTVTVADLSPTDGSPVSISGQIRTKNRQFSSIATWIDSVTRARTADDEGFVLSHAGPVQTAGGRTGELLVLDSSKSANGPGSSIDYEAVVLIDEPRAIAEIFLTTKTRELRDRHLSTLRAIAETYGPAV
jgi:hypothetical protein